MLYSENPCRDKTEKDYLFCLMKSEDFVLLSCRLKKVCLGLQLYFAINKIIRFEHAVAAWLRREFFLLLSRWAVFENFSVKFLPFTYKGTQLAVREWGFPMHHAALFSLEKVSSQIRDSWSRIFLVHFFSLNQYLYRKHLFLFRV